MRLREVRPEHIATSCNRVQVVVFLCLCARVSLEKACGCFIGQFCNLSTYHWTSVLPATNHQPFLGSDSKRY